MGRPRLWRHSIVATFNCSTRVKLTVVIDAGCSNNLWHGVDCSDGFSKMSALSKKQFHIGPWLVALAGIAVLHVAHLQVIQLLPYKFEFEKKRFIMRPDIARACSLGFQRLNADLNWLNFVQYYGDRRSAIEDKFKHAPDYLRLIIKMDPHFKAPYWFASFVLAGDLKRLDDAAQILDEGIANNPDDWNLLYIAGFNQYFYGHDQDKAAEYYERASKIKGAPPFLAGFAEIMRSHVMVAIQLVVKQWEQVYKHADNASTREKAQQQLQLLWSAVYNEAPTEPIKQHALEKLKEYDCTLVTNAVLPKDLKAQLSELKSFDQLIKKKNPPIPEIKKAPEPVKNK